MPNIHKRIVLWENLSKDQAQEALLELLWEYELVQVCHDTHLGCKLVRMAHLGIDLTRWNTLVLHFDLDRLDTQFFLHKCGIHRG